MIFQILRLFPNILGANDKYSVVNREKLIIAIQMQLYHKQKTFAQFFSEFLKCGLYIEHTLKEDGPRRIFISKIPDSKHVVR